MEEIIYIYFILVRMRDERNGNHIVFYFRTRVERNEKCKVVFDVINTVIPVSPQSLGKR